MGRLSQTQQQVLEMYTLKNLKPKQIAEERNTTVQSVYKIIKKLRKKGYLDRGFKGGLKSSMPIIIKRYWRLHNLHLVVTPYHFYPRYIKNIKRIVPIGQWTVTVNTSNIELQLKSKESFNSRDIDDCLRQARVSIENTIRSIEHDIGCEIWKHRKLNIKLVNHHMAEVENGIAKLRQGEKLKVYGEDGKVWLVIDKSTGVPELETVDPILATDDAKLLEKYYNDYRYHTPPTNSELARFVLENSKLMNHYGGHWKSHVKWVKEGTEVSIELKKILVKLDKKLDEIPNRFLSKPSGQLRLRQLSLRLFIG